MAGLLSNAGAIALAGCTIFLGSAEAETVAKAPNARVPKRCTFAKPARLIRTMSDDPEIAAEFKRQGLEVADVGAAFVASDVVDDVTRKLPHRIFVRGYAFDYRVIVWYYRGGLAANYRAVEMRHSNSNNDQERRLQLTGTSLGGPLCVTTQAILDGVRATDGW